jgi:hypothetical protein
MKKITPLLVTTLIFLVSSVQSQVQPQHRYPKQRHFEDSARVFWTSYPNPFSPPTVKDTTKGLIYGDLTFYCDLSDSVEVAFVTKNDSIVHRATIRTAKPPYFSVGYWVAGENIRQASLPPSYFKPNRDEHLRLVLIVGGRWKTIRELGIPVQRGRYYWIDTRKHSKQ